MADAVEQQNSIKSKMKIVTSVTKCSKRALLDLLVTVSGMLEADHYAGLGSMLWHHCLLDHASVNSAAVSLQVLPGHRC